ncbi:hypothetical protein [Streptomyces tendae]|uniref:hypothetical protein n=1 Tax=Streptomyces tendae TaxID=1932 RepID=UPI003D755CF9
MPDQTTTPESFRFTDADGDYLHIGIPNSPTGGSPAVSFHTMAEPVHVPVEELEGLIAAVRSMAAAQSPAAPLPPAVQSPVREQLLNAIDFSYCQTLGFGTPEGLLAAYEASRTQTVDRDALREAVARAIYGAHSDVDVWDQADDHTRAVVYAEADAALAAVLPATTNHDTDTSAILAKAADRAEIVALRLRLKHDYGAANGAYEVGAELRRVADATAATETDTLPAWLHWRFGPHGQPWAEVPDEDKALWEYQARAVRRAVARGGFKERAAGARQDGAQ